MENSRLSRLLDEARGALDEAAPKRMKVRKAGSGSKRAIKKCGPGMAQKDGRCVRKSSTIKARQKRQKKRWRKSGSGRKSAKKSVRLHKRFAHADLPLGKLIGECREMLSES
jgi:hypothetical protein